eukprot:scaffold144111_cov24-Tisochrysis_lutea.AAC.2
MRCQQARGATPEAPATNSLCNRPVMVWRHRRDSGLPPSFMRHVCCAAEGVNHADTGVAMANVWTSFCLGT